MFLENERINEWSCSSTELPSCCFNFFCGNYHSYVRRRTVRWLSDVALDFSQLLITFCYRFIAHSLIHSLTHLPTHSLVHPSARSLARPISLVHSLARHLLTLSFTHSLIHLLLELFRNSCLLAECAQCTACAITASPLSLSLSLYACPCLLVCLLVCVRSW